MSKKFEAIKQTVFYAHETPEKLAGTITVVATAGDKTAEMEVQLVA